MRLSALVLCLALSSAYAQDEAPSTPAVEKAAEAPVEKAPPAGEPKKEEAKAEEKKEEPKAEPAKVEEKAPEPEPAAEPKPEPKKKDKEKEKEKVKEAPAPKPVQAAASPDDEFKFLKSASETKDKYALDAALAELFALTERRPAAAFAAEALALAAAMQQRKGDANPALVTLLRVVYEFPGTKQANQSRSAFVELGSKKLSRKLKPALPEMVKAPESSDAATRLATMLERLSGELGSELYEPAVAELRRFERRFPDYAGGDKLLWSAARLHEKAENWAAAEISYRMLIAVHPGSETLPAARYALAGIYAGSMKEYKRAIDTYLELVEKHTDSPRVLDALQAAAQLYAERLKQYEFAVEIVERIIKTFPSTDGALKAFRDAATLRRNRLSQPAEAIKTYRRLREQFEYPAGLEALRDAATIARKDLKDYAQEVELRKKIAADFASSKEAADELFTAAEVLEDDLKDTASAIAAYKELETKFAGSKPAKKAKDRVAKLEKLEKKPE